MPYSSGTTPWRGDTVRTLLAKRLGALQAAAGALPANDAKPNDTRRRLRVRIVNSRGGLATH